MYQTKSQAHDTTRPSHGNQRNVDSPHLAPCRPHSSLRQPVPERPASPASEGTAACVLCDPDQGQTSCEPAASRVNNNTRDSTRLLSTGPPGARAQLPEPGQSFGVPCSLQAPQAPSDGGLGGQGAGNPGKVPGPAHGLPPDEPCTSRPTHPASDSPRSWEVTP